MIIGYVSDRHLRAAVRRAAHPEEDVIVDRQLAAEALAVGYPRLVIHAAPSPSWQLPSAADPSLPVLTLSEGTLARWEADRRATPLPAGKVEWLASRLGALVQKEATEPTWVDRVLGDLSRAAGAPLPLPLRTFGRRVMEFPARYVDLHPMAELCGLSRGALKARFRRRALPSPYAYLRWFRVLSCAYVLADRSVTVAQAANRLGYTSDGNLCRSMRSVTPLTPTEARTLHGWNRLLITFAWTHLGSEALKGWSELDDLFVRRVA